MPEFNTKKMTTISVVMPNYNDSAHIEAQLLAICEQSYKPYEVIVVDDGSGDNSVELISEFAKQYPFVRLLTNKENRGLIYSVNRGVRFASGDYIYIPASNDLVLPGLFEKSVELLSLHPNAAFCCSNGYMQKNGRLWELSHNWLHSPGYISPQELAEITRRTNQASVPFSHSCIIRRNLIPAPELWNPNLECYCDWFFYQVLALRHGCCFLPDRLVTQRWSGDSYCETVKRNSAKHRRIFLEAIKLLTSSEYQDVLALMIRGRTLSTFPSRLLTPVNVLAAFWQVRAEKGTRDEALRLDLLQHAAIEYSKFILCLLPDLVNNLGKKLQQNFIIPAAYRLGNITAQAYAQAFHHYDRLRASIRRRIKQGIEN